MSASEDLEKRLREVVRATDLRTSRRLHPKIDYGAEAVARRLRTVEALRRAVLALGREVRPVDAPDDRDDPR